MQLRNPSPRLIRRRSLRDAIDELRNQGMILTATQPQVKEQRERLSRAQVLGRQMIQHRGGYVN